MVLEQWINTALPFARDAVQSTENSQWLRCGGTWFAGVNVLPNDEHGAVAGGQALAGDAVSFIRDELGLSGVAWDRAQVSVCYPGYPKPMDEDSDANFAFRRDRDAAHVDGLRREGENRRRFLREFHGFILGIPLVSADADASPLVVWEGSHHVVRDTFRHLYAGIDPARWHEVDVTEAYHAMRRSIFDNCARVIVTASPGEAYLIHRLALHGVAPWRSTAAARADGRMIAYFRPETGNVADWVFAP